MALDSVAKLTTRCNYKSHIPAMIPENCKKRLHVYFKDGPRSLVTEFDDAKSDWLRLGQYSKGLSESFTNVVAHSTIMDAEMALKDVGNSIAVLMKLSKQAGKNSVLRQAWARKRILEYSKDLETVISLSNAGPRSMSESNKRAKMS